MLAGFVYSLLAMATRNVGAGAVALAAFMFAGQAFAYSLGFEIDTPAWVSDVGLLAAAVEFGSAFKEGASILAQQAAATVQNVQAGARLGAWGFTAIAVAAAYGMLLAGVLTYME